MVLGGFLVLLSIVDALTLRLPNVLTAMLALGGLVECWWLEPAAILDRVAAGGVGLLAFLVVGEAYRHLRQRDGLGRGDAKFLGASGTWLGVMGLPSVVFLSALLGLAWAVALRAAPSKRSLATRLPYGPFIAAATWLVWLYGPILPFD
jgi:prepilin signal peptidase PulO-like enzyme (type II secretory pathway)